LGLVGSGPEVFDTGALKTAPVFLTLLITSV
jgi:hypothetical protein